MEFHDEHHAPQQSGDTKRRGGAAQACLWLDSASGRFDRVFPEGLPGASSDPTLPCWAPDPSTDIVAMLASQHRLARATPPTPDDPDSLKPISLRRWPLAVIGLLVVVYVGMAVFTAVCAWEQPGSGMLAVVPVVVLGGWVILHPVVSPRLRRRRRR